MSAVKATAVAALTPERTHCFFSGIVMIQTAPADTNVVELVVDASSQGPAYPLLNAIYAPDGMDITIGYYNQWKFSFLPGAVAFVQGVLSVDPGSSGHPRVSVRADQLVP